MVMFLPRNTEQENKRGNSVKSMMKQITDQYHSGCLGEKNARPPLMVFHVTKDKNFKVD